MEITHVGDYLYVHDENGKEIYKTEFKPEKGKTYSITPGNNGFEIEEE